MNLNNLIKITKHSKKRLGRGHGSGRVKTSGRGTKGQNARGKMRPYFEGGQLPLIKRLPFLKGKSKNKPLTKKPLVLNLKSLNILPKNTLVDNDSLVKYKIVPQKAANQKIKILGDGEITIPLTVHLPCSHSAQQKIIQAGGTVDFKS